MNNLKVVSLILVGIFITALVGAWSLNFNDELLVYYNMSSFEDISPAGIDLKNISGNTTFNTTDCLIGSCAHIDGGAIWNLSSNVFGTVPHKNVTLNWWINKTDTNSGKFFDSAGQLTAEGINRFDINQFTSGELNTGVFPYGVWHMITLTRNDTHGCVWVNASIKECLVASDNNFTQDLTMLSSAAGADPWRGDIDEFGVWNRTLTLTEISDLFNNRSGVNFTSGATTNFNSTTYEGALEHFGLNVTIDTTDDPNVTLWWNNTAYTTTRDDLGDNDYYFYRELGMPSIGTDSAQTKDVIFEVDYGTSNSNSTTESQILNNTNLSICVEGITIPYLNFSYSDEKNDSTINAQIDSSTWVYYLTGGNSTFTKTMTYDSSNVADANHTFCFYPNDRGVTLDSLEYRYSATNYPQRTYSLSGTALTNTTTHTGLTLLSSGDGIYVTFQVVDVTDVPISGVAAQAEKIEGATYTIVQTGETGDDGGVTMWLDPDFPHRFTFTRSGYDTGIYTITPTQSQYTIVLSGTSNVTDYDFGRGISYYTRPANYTLNNDTDYVFEFEINASYWTLEEFGYSLFNSTDDLIGRNSSTTGTGGTVSTLNNTGNSTRMRMDYYWIIDGNYTNNSRYWNIVPAFNESWGLRTFFEDLKDFTGAGTGGGGIFGLNEFTRGLLVFLIIFVLVGMMSYVSGIYSPGTVLLEVAILVTFFDIGMGMIPRFGNAAIPFPTILMWIIVIAYGFREARR